jgi:hypothetical protein
MNEPMPWWVRAYLLLGTAQATGIGTTGFLAPASIQIPLQMTPLNARFIGALYLAAATGVLLAAFGRNRAEGRLFVIAFGLATGLILVVNLLRWHEFMAPGLQHRPFWLFTYILDPSLALLIIAKAYRKPPAVASHRLSRLFTLEFLVLAVLGVFLLVVPTTVASYWPWKLPPALGQLYGCFFIAIGSGAWMAARDSSPTVVRNFIITSLALSVLVLVASLMHPDKFVASPVTQIWFAGFTTGAIAFAAALVLWEREVRASKSAVRPATGSGIGLQP